MEDYNGYSEHEASQAEQPGGQQAQGGSSPENGPAGGYYRHGGVDYGPAEKKKGRAGGYVLTGALCLLLGMALGGCSTALLISSVDNRGGWSYEYRYDSGDSIGDILEDFFGGGDEQAGQDAYIKPWEDEEYEETEPQDYIRRELPEFDGAQPVISDGVNPVPDIVEQVYDGVVGINTYYDGMGFGEAAGYGSGFVVSREGYIITNEHVVRDASEITVTFSDGEETEAELVGSDVKLDLAVLKVDKGGLTPLALGDSDGIRVGEFSLAMGNPSGAELAGSATFGIISATSRTINVEGQVFDYIQTDAAINMGSSGGPLLDMNGLVIGITSAKNIYAGYDEYGTPIAAEGLGFAIPINEAMAVVEQLITQGHVVRPGLGINVIMLTAEDAEHYDVVEGVLIYSVTRNGPAHKAGLKVDDIVTEYDGITPDSQDAFVEYVKGLNLGDVITMTVWRDGETLEIEAELGDMNQMGSDLVGNRVSELFD